MGSAVVSHRLVTIYVPVMHDQASALSSDARFKVYFLKSVRLDHPAPSLRAPGLNLLLSSDLPFGIGIERG